jgi:hypothetical protein
VAVAQVHGARLAAPESGDAWSAAARPVWETFAPRLGGMDKVKAILETR